MPVRFSRIMFQAFWIRLFKSSWGGICVSVVCSPCSSLAILGFFYLRIVLGPVSSQFQWKVLAWGEVLCNTWLRFAFAILDKTWLDCSFPVGAKILCSFSRLFWRMHWGKTIALKSQEDFYWGALSSLTCFFCLWAHSLLQCMHLRARYSHPLSLNKKYWNFDDTPVLLLIAAKMTWEFVRTSWEIWGGEKVEDCCFCVFCVNIVSTQCSCAFSSTRGETCLRVPVPDLEAYCLCYEAGIFC